MNLRSLDLVPMLVATIVYSDIPRVEVAHGSPRGGLPLFGSLVVGSLAEQTNLNKKIKKI